MEGPSLVLLKEELQPFKGKKVLEASGTSPVNLKRLKGARIADLKSWGKHFLIVFDRVTIRIHFLMFGSYRVNDRKTAAPRLRLAFAKGEEINFYTCSVVELEGALEDIYDWSADVMSDAWDPSKARRKLKKLPALNVGDALLEQNIFSGVGNIIKNEVLFRIRVHPGSVVGALPPKKLSELIKQARIYSFDFYDWKKVFQLKKHWLIHTKRMCPRCNIAAVKEYTGLKKRRSFFCPSCQVLYQP